MRPAAVFFIPPLPSVYPHHAALQPVANLILWCMKLRASVPVMMGVTGVVVRRSVRTADQSHLCLAVGTGSISHKVGRRNQGNDSQQGDGGQTGCHEPAIMTRRKGTRRVGLAISELDSAVIAKRGSVLRRRVT